MSAANRTCFIHFPGENGHLTPFTDVSFKRVLECWDRWLKLEGEQREVAENLIHTSSGYDYEGLFYYRGMHSKLTNTHLLS